METTTIFAISMTAEFLGRYSTAQEAFKAHPEDAIFPMELQDVSDAKFTKKQLNQLVGLDEKELKNIKSDELCDRYWAILMTKELSTPTKTKRSQKSENGEPKAKPGLIHVIHNHLSTAPYYIAVDEFMTSENAKLKCFQSLVSNLQNEKYSQGLPILSIKRGTLNIDEVPTTIIYNSEYPPENLTTKEKKMPKEKKDAEGNVVPKAEGLQSKLRKFFTDGGCATKAELAEMFSVEVKNISDQVCYLKNPKFAGTLGAINLVTAPNDKTVQIQPEGYVVPEKVKPVKAPKTATEATKDETEA